MFKDIHKDISTSEKEKKIELTSENIKEIWDNFLNDNKEKLQPTFVNLAQLHIPELFDDKLRFTLPNNISSEILQLHKMDITAYFRKCTTSEKIAPEFIVLKSAEADYTIKSSKDRLKDMVEKNPAVLMLIKKFELMEN